MDDAKTLKCALRTEDFGSRGSRRVRRSGRIPAVVYGKEAPCHITLDAREFSMKRRGFGESTLITLKIEGDKDRSVFVKALQENLMYDRIDHVDFYEITAGQAVRTRIRLEFEGTPKGVRDGGVLDILLHEIEVEALPKDLIDMIKVDVSNIEVNENLRVSDIKVPDTIKVLTSEEAPVATVKNVKEEKSAEGEDGAEGTEATTPTSDAENTK